jgi:hypothetical protein
VRVRERSKVARRSSECDSELGRCQEKARCGEEDVEGRNKLSAVVRECPRCELAVGEGLECGVYDGIPRREMSLSFVARITMS